VSESAAAAAAAREHRAGVRGRTRDADAPDTVGELIAVYLDPALWSTGLGGRLHAAAVADLATPCEQATSWVLEGNTRARAFYERQNWRPDGTVKPAIIGEAEVVEVRYRRSLQVQVAPGPGRSRSRTVADRPCPPPGSDDLPTRTSPRCVAAG
jgi:hypothetical protein